MITSLAAIVCLARNIYYEAGREPWAGKVAVGEVTLNRAHWDNRLVCKVVYAWHWRRSKRVAAFSWTLGKAWRGGGWDQQLYDRCAWIAIHMMYYGLRSDIIDTKVLHYRADYVHPAWARKLHVVARIGHHIFYEG